MEGHLYLIVDQMDHNLDPSSTMQMVNALVKADKNFDLLAIPNGEHAGANGFRDYCDRRLRDFLVRHLIQSSAPPFQD